jgi:hypothetical protein
MKSPRKIFLVHAGDRVPDSGGAGQGSISRVTGQNPAVGRRFVLPEGCAQGGAETKIEILDASGKVIQYSGRVSAGNPLRRTTEAKEIKPRSRLEPVRVGLRLRRHSVPGYYLWEYGSGARGPVAVPGHYQVRLTVGSQTQTAGFDLKLDPRVKVSQEDLEAQFKLLIETRDELSQVYDAVNQIQDVRSQLSGLKRRLPENTSTKTIVSAADDLEKKLVAVREDENACHDQRERGFAGVSSAAGRTAGIPGNGCWDGGFGAHRGRGASVGEAEAADGGTNRALGRLAAAGSGGVPEAYGTGQLVDSRGASSGAGCR